ncbi:DUF5916 domain-containing protein [Melioribacter sp. OK-6-Me]|uniref:DUF5916 domain-containing protein n=1 Tax=unclassified Melioribacter TaxID=2627329 RepID=UPI003ED8D026
MFSLLLILLIQLLTTNTEAACRAPTIKAFKLENTEIHLDGKIIEQIWQYLPIDNFTQRDPNEGMPASERTEVWIAYDDEYLYIAAKLYDSHPELIDASLTRKDNYILSDWFGFYVDPYNDKKSGFFFAVNAGGSVIDGILFNDSWDDDTWDGIWEAKTSIEDFGWSVEIKIPFSQLRFKEENKMKWGVNFAREIKRKNERSYFVMVPKNESGFVSHFATLEGINGIKATQKIEVLPYLLQKTQFLVHDAGDPFYKSNQFKTYAGADIKLGIGSNLNMNLTINPDFGQVEVDPAVINLSAFESYFREKRPFFVEGADLFYFGIGGSNSNWNFNFGWPELFYSRRIGKTPTGNLPDEYDYADFPGETRILGAAKISGKINQSTTIGAISALTERTFAKIYSQNNISEYEVEPLTHYGVLRLKREFNEGKQSLGLMFTSVNRDLHDNDLKELLSRQAYTIGLDGWSFLDDDKQYVLSGAFAGSYIEGTKEFLINLQERPHRYFQRPDASFSRLDSTRTSLAGYFGRLMLNKQHGNFYFNMALGAASPGFEFNDLGFQWLADRLNGHVVIGYRWYEPAKIFREKFIYAAHSRSFDYDGNLLNNFLWFRSGGTFHNYHNIRISGHYSFEKYTKTLTRGGPLAIDPANYSVDISFGTDNRNKIAFDFDYEYSANDAGSNSIELQLEIDWKPTSQINLIFEPEYKFGYETRQWIDAFDDPTATATYNKRYVFGKIKQDVLSANIRLNWTFTPTLSLQLYLQPFLAVGKYSEFKELAQPGTDNFINYTHFRYDSAENIYYIDPDGEGDAEEISFENPDFNYKSLRGNAVLRWEFVPGSIFYFVWSHNQTNYDYAGNFDFSRDIKSLWKSTGDDIFLVKFSYWINI